MEHKVEFTDSRWTKVQYNGQIYERKDVMYNGNPINLTDYPIFIWERESQDISKPKHIRLK